MRLIHKWLFRLRATLLPGRMEKAMREEMAFHMEMEAEKLVAERMAAVGQTVATLSHHIKNILQGIRGGSYLIEEGLKQQDTGLIQRGWGIVDRNQEKISNLVMDMLSFSKEREPMMEPAELPPMRPLRKEIVRTQQPPDLARVRRMAEDRQPERRLGHEERGGDDGGPRSERGAILPKRSGRTDRHLSRLPAGIGE